VVRISRLNESLLEMVYFSPFKGEFHKILGHKVNAIYKPSQQKEAWLGFDQAWTNEEISEDEFYDIIINKKKTKRFIAYIMQFKVVEKQQHFTKRARTFTVPGHIKNGETYYRSRLKTEPSKTGTTSQHEMLVDMKKLNNFLEVYYVCPMLFTNFDLYRSDFLEDDSVYHKYLLDQLVLVDVATAPDPTTKKWKSFSNHHMIWKEFDGNDMEWCSEPEKGRKESFKAWIEGLNQKFMTNEELIDNLKTLEVPLAVYEGDRKVFRDVYSKLTILEIGEDIHI